MSTYPVQTQSFEITGSGAVAGGNTITLQSFLDILGNPITMSYFGAVGYGTIEPNTSNEDSISFTGITQNANGTATLTGVNSLGFFTPFTASVGLRISHAGSVTFIITNTSAFYNNFANKLNQETIAQNWAVPDPIGMTDIANKEYVLSVVNGGAVSVASVIVAATAGATVSAGQVVYLNASGQWALADATNSATVFNVQLGIAQGAGTSGNSITGGVLIEGVDSNQSGISAGSNYYVRNGGGLPSSSAGTFARIIGVGSPTSTKLFVNSATDVITGGNVSTTSVANAIPKANSSGFISEGFIENIISESVDQSQITANQIQVVGANNATTVHYLLAEKFIPTNPSISGVTLFKTPDTGTFVGTVKISLQADSAGSPSGVDLASYTIPNAAWLKLNSSVFSPGDQLIAANLFTVGGVYPIVTGTPIFVSDISGITGLTVNTVYYAYVASSTTFGLATTLANALAGTLVSISGTPGSQNWYLYNPFTVNFTTEYESMVVGNPYWIVITPSTNDSSNHPNLGSNSAGGYASGSLKFFNATDGWVQIATSILYFITKTGNLSKLSQTDSDTGLIPLQNRPYSFLGTDANGNTTSGTSETVLSSLQVPAGTFTLNGGIHIRVMLANSSTGTPTIAVRYNGVRFATIAGLATASVQIADFYITNKGVFNYQAIGISVISMTAAAANNTITASNTPVNNVDTSGPGLLEVTVAMTSGTGTHRMTIYEKIA